jgi:hypothetical protein
MTARRLVHGQRYMVCLIVLGLLHALVVAVASERFAPQVLYIFASGWSLALLLSPAAWITGWILRFPIARAAGLASFPVAVLATALGSLTSSGVLFLGIVLAEAWDGNLRGVADAVLDLPGLVLFSGLGLLYLGWISLPLTWLAVVVLRRAAGGLEDLRAVG